MNRGSADGSIFAPLVVAVPPHTEWSGFGNAFYAAVNGIPTTSALYRVDQPKSLFKKMTIVRERRVFSLSGDAVAPFTYAARCTDVEVDGPKSGAGGACWQVGVRHLKDGLLTPAVPADWDSAMLHVLRFRLSSTGLSGASQLALLRHRWASAVLAASRESIVFGGQHDWRPEWWTEEEAQLREA